MTIAKLGSLVVKQGEGSHVWTLPLDGKVYTAICALTSVTPHAVPIPIESRGKISSGESFNVLGIANVTEMGPVSVVIAQFQDAHGVRNDYNLPHAQLEGGVSITFVLTAAPILAATAVFVITEP